MMVSLIFWTAFCAALAGAVVGNRTSWVLITSVLLVKVLEAEGVAFSLYFWTLIDFAVILAIIHPRMRYRDCVVLALFIPAWALYACSEQVRYVGVTLVVAAQLFLTFPIHRTNFLAQRVWKRDRARDHDKMEMAFV